MKLLKFKDKLAYGGYNLVKKVAKFLVQMPKNAAHCTATRFRHVPCVPESKSALIAYVAAIFHDLCQILTSNSAISGILGVLDDILKFDHKLAEFFSQSCLAR